VCFHSRHLENKVESKPVINTDLGMLLDTLALKQKNDAEFDLTRISFLRMCKLILGMSVCTYPSGWT